MPGSREGVARAEHEPLLSLNVSSYLVNQQCSATNASRATRDNFSLYDDDGVRAATTVSLSLSLSRARTKNPSPHVENGRRRLSRSRRKVTPPSPSPSFHPTVGPESRSLPRQKQITRRRGARLEVERKVRGERETSTAWFGVRRHWTWRSSFPSWKVCFFVGHGKSSCPVQRDFDSFRVFPIRLRCRATLSNFLVRTFRPGHETFRIFAGKFREPRARLHDEFSTLPRGLFAILFVNPV